jgi:hypothetical protein
MFVDIRGVEAARRRARGQGRIGGRRGKREEEQEEGQEEVGYSRLPVAQSYSAFVLPYQKFFQGQILRGAGCRERSGGRLPGIPHPSHVVPCHAATLHEKYLPCNTFLALDLTNSAGYVLLFVRQCRATTRRMFSAIARRRGARSCGAMTCGLATSPSL